MADYGYIYYPHRCVNGTVESCKVHMFLHGCYSVLNSNLLGIDGPLIDGSGLFHYAASNDLIVIMP